jgi:predicted nuclease with RNAse H fold
MNQHEPGSIVVGVDVGEPKNGFHAVALRDEQYCEKLSTPIAKEVAAWCQRLKVSVVGIDAP